ncbi:MAG: hypothetical protein PHW77_01620 [Eubacteriales bacterium]|nr:hypothetical protein [Eubacteriales bacterium]
MKHNIAITARKLVERQINDGGFIIWDVRYEKEAGVWNLVFELDRVQTEEGNNASMSMNDCEKANTIIEAVIDKADLIEGSYMLEVSSAGLTRILRTDYHFETALKKNWEVQIKLYSAADGIKETIGRIASVSGEEIEINNIKINRKNIAKAVAILG